MTDAEFPPETRPSAVGRPDELAGAPIRTPDQRVRVFLSSTIEELAAERRAARAAIECLRQLPVFFESGARPHPPRALYRAYLAQSQVFVGIYWRSYGWVTPDMEVSGVEDEYRLSEGKPRLIYVKAPAPDRDPRLAALLDRVKDSGHVSYKRFGTAEELGELLANDLATLLAERFAASTEARSSFLLRRLPSPPAPFVGREREVEAATALLRRDGVRLLTMTGPGGVGKTRLALEVGRRIEVEYADGGAFVDLAGQTDPALVPSTILQALGMREEGSEAPAEQLRDFLLDKSLLLVLDNVEHVLESAPAVADLLAVCPGVTILATGRARLRLRAEREVPVVPMAGDEAVSLFEERARTVRPDFALTPETAPIVGEICRRLDRLPLAVELAAARVRTLSPPAILARLDERFRLLVGGPRDAPPRQRTMRDAVAWSHDLLLPEEQALFRRLAVFAGPFSVEAAGAVQRAAGQLEIDTPDGLDALAAASLLGVEHGADGEPRFRMLETIRQFALERLAASGEAGETERALVAYCVALAERAEPNLRGPDQARWLDRLEEHLDEFRAALTRCVESGELATALRLVAALWRFWYVRGHIFEGRGWLDRVLETASLLQAEASHRAEALEGAAGLAYLQGDYQAARARYEEALALRRPTGNRSQIAALLGNLANVAAAEGNYPWAGGLYAEALELMRASGDERGLGSMLTNVGNFVSGRGDRDRAARYHAESIELLKRVGDRQMLAISLVNLGTVEQARGNLAIASAVYEEAIAIGRAVGDRAILAAAFQNLGNIARHLGDPGTAAQHYKDSLKIKREFGDRRGIATTLHSLASAAREAGRYDEAEAHLVELDALSREVGNPEWAARSLLGLGNVARDRGQNAAAAELYQECLWLCRRIGYQEGIAAALNNLTTVAPVDDATLVAMLTEAREEFESLGDREGVASALHNLGDAADRRGDAPGALGFLRQALVIQREHGDRESIASLLEAIARILADLGRFDRAVRLYAAAAALRAAIAAPLPGPARPAHEQRLDAARAALGVAEFDRAWSAGERLPLTEAVDAALAATAE